MSIKTSVDSKRNYNVDFVRIIFALQIVALHTSPFVECNSYFSYLLCHIYSRLAVPFFAAVSGYYLFKDYSVEKAMTYIKKLVISYVFWNSLSCLIDIILGYTEGSIILFLINAFIFKGQHALWYMLALIYTVILTIIVYKLKIKRVLLYSCSIVLLLIGVLIYAYGNLFFEIVPIKYIYELLDTDILNGLPFVIIPYFSMGYVLKCNVEKRKGKKIGCFSVAVLLHIQLR